MLGCFDLYVPPIWFSVFKAVTKYFVFWHFLYIPLKNKLETVFKGFLVEELGLIIIEHIICRV